MKRVKQFGETVEGYNIPVLNEREIRASAGILYLVMFWSWILVVFNDNYLLLKYANTIFLADFIVRIFISPKYSPLLIIGRLAFGICLGCKFYSMFYKEKAQYCPGEICDVNAKQEIQKTSLLQIAVVIGFFAFVITTAILFNDGFGAKPTSLWFIVKSAFSI
ncbi:MAG: hypothetical protein IPO36_18200 [Anaerolineales bacterium]|nr:hypothetical protein [Anaerolineales bacterium]